MFKLNDKLVIDFTPYVDKDSLLTLKPYLDYAIIKNIEYQVPAQYAGYLLLDKGTGFHDVTPEFRQNLIEKYPYLINLSYKELLLWLRYTLDIIYGQSHLAIISARTWEGKHLRENSDVTNTTESFRPFLDWLDQQNIFSNYGRITIFLNEPNCFTPIHFDPPYPDVSPKDEFIWITLDNRKRFFIIDNDTQEKTYIQGYVGTFDNHNYHGSEPSNYANWSLRVDGVFSDSFLLKTDLYNHFRG